VNYDRFLGQVQSRLRLSSRQEAVRATRVVLTALGERLQEGEAKDLAGPLPMEIDRFLLEADSGQRFPFDEFVARVADGERIDRADAVYHAQQLMTVVAEAVPSGEFRQVREQLPEDYEVLFRLVDTGTATP
jgi:uncharacterized protein (DUF2267 family)